MDSETLSAQIRPVQLYQDIWLESFRQILAAVSQQVNIERIPSDPPQDSALSNSGAWFRLAVGGQLEGEHACRISPPDAFRLVQEVAPEAAGVMDAVLTDGHRESLKKLFMQVAEAASAELKTKAGWDVAVTLEAISSPSWPPEAPVSMRISVPNMEPIRIDSFSSPELERALFNATNLPDQQSGAPVAAIPLAAASSGVMERLMDAQLDVVLRFGERQMLLRDILELNSGSVVEFEHDIEDQVELLVAGKGFARGEVVVVDGNYGLRITEIATPQQREDFLGRKGPQRESAAARPAVKGVSQ